MNILKLFVEVLQLQMRKRMMHLSCRFLSFMEGKDFAEILKGEEETKKWYQTMCRLSVLFSSLFLPQLCDHFVFIFRSSSWVSQGHEIPIWIAFQLWISYGKKSPPKVAVCHGGQGHTSRADIPMKRRGKKLRMDGLCRGCGISFCLLCFFFFGKNCKGCFFCFFMVMEFFRHINQPVCVRLSG